MTDRKKLLCLKCGHDWWPYNPEKLPDCCPKCKSRHWATGAKKKGRPQAGKREADYVNSGMVMVALRALMQEVIAAGRKPDRRDALHIIEIVQFVPPKFNFKKRLERKRKVAKRVRLYKKLPVKEG